MPRDRMQRQRFERKYRITEEQALAVREFVNSYLELDEHGIGKPNYSYPIHSLYLDSDDLATYWMTVNSNKNRYKLRLRFYNAQPETPVFLEIKRRVDNCILKQRAAVWKQAVPEVLAGHRPKPGELFSPSEKAWAAIETFSQLMAELQARPKVHVAYLREAWMDPENDAIRITFDREVRGGPAPEARFSTEVIRPVHPFGHIVILELKFTDRFPHWLQEMVERFSLMPCSAAKYCESVDQIGLENLGARLHRQPQPPDLAPPPREPEPARQIPDEVNHRPLPNKTASDAGSEVAQRSLPE